MSQNVVLALLWLAFSTGLIAGFALFIGWLEDGREGRNAQRPAE
jgi:hypothetical protein